MASLSSEPTGETAVMPVHDWTRVDVEIFHDFRHGWRSALLQALKNGLSPSDYYALVEHQADGFGPHFPTPSLANNADAEGSRTDCDSGLPVRSTITVRHARGDQLVAVIEIASPGDETGGDAQSAVTNKARALIKHRIHLLILDLFPPSKRDPNGVHAAIWDAVADEPFVPLPEKPLTMVAYESAMTVRAFIEPVAVGDPLPDMPLFLEPGAHILIPLEATYQAAFDTVPARWRRVLEVPAG